MFEKQSPNFNLYPSQSLINSNPNWKILFFSVYLKSLVCRDEDELWTDKEKVFKNEVIKLILLTGTERDGFLDSSEKLWID